jgi:hypothetical protein
MMIASDGSQGMNCKQPGMYKKIRIGTQNMLTLNKGGALRNMEKVLQEYKVDITTLQETRWVGEGILERWSSNIHQSCQKSKHEFGCGFIVSKEVKHLGTDFTAVQHRICTLKS